MKPPRPRPRTRSAFGITPRTSARRRRRYINAQSIALPRMGADAGEGEEEEEELCSQIPFYQRGATFSTCAELLDEADAQAELAAAATRARTQPRAAASASAAEEGATRVAGRPREMLLRLSESAKRTAREHIDALAPAERSLRAYLADVSAAAAAALAKDGSAAGGSPGADGAGPPDVRTYDDDFEVLGGTPATAAARAYEVEKGEGAAGAARRKGARAGGRRPRRAQPRADAGRAAPPLCVLRASHSDSRRRALHAACAFYFLKSWTVTTRTGEPAVAARLVPPRRGSGSLQRWRGLLAAAQVSLCDALLELDTSLAGFEVVSAAR